MFETFTIEEKEVLKKAIEEIKECGLLVGKYDALNGSKTFMFGISTAMECFAYGVSDEYGEEFSDLFLKNMSESEKALDN